MQDDNLMHSHTFAKTIEIIDWKKLFKRPNVIEKLKSGISLRLRIFYASHEVSSTISVGMDISSDFLQPNTCDILIERVAV